MASMIPVQQASHPCGSRLTSTTPGVVSNQPNHEGQLTVITINSTTWSSFRKWLLAQSDLPDLIAVQEHKLTSKADIEEASDFASKQGYASFWGAATKGPKGLPAGGVATLVNKKLGSKPCQTDAAESRLIVCKVQIPSESEFLFASAYLHSGRGLKQVNLELLGSIAAQQRKENRYLLAAGDWQNQPRHIASIGWLNRAGLATVAPSRATCVMKKTSTTIDFMIVSSELAGRCSPASIKASKHIATHRPVGITLSTGKDHTEPRMCETTRFPSLPPSPTGPYNKPADWSPAASIVEAAIAAAHAAAEAGSKKATKQAQRLLDRAYVAMVNTAELELESVFDTPVTKPGLRAKPAKIRMVKSKPLQPRTSIRVACGALPCRWLTEQGHRYYQHLLQTISIRPKSVDGETFAEFHEQLLQDTPSYVDTDVKAKHLRDELLLQTEGVLTDLASGILVDSRPAALAALRLWEDKLKKVTGTAEGRDRMEAQKGWREWALEAASCGAGKCHRWTKVPAPWRPNVAQSAPKDQDAIPTAILHDLKLKFSKIWQPMGVPYPSPSKVLFPSWLPPLSETTPESWGLATTSSCYATEAALPGKSGGLTSMHGKQDDEPFSAPACEVQGFPVRENEPLRSAAAPCSARSATTSMDNFDQPHVHGFPVRENEPLRSAAAPCSARSTTTSMDNFDQPLDQVTRSRRMAPMSEMPSGSRGLMAQRDIGQEKVSHQKPEQANAPNGSMQHITAEQVSMVSKSFRPGTAQTYDGLHVRHWAHLQTPGQDLVAKLMCLSLALGTLPSPIQAVVATGIPKATTGFRTIGLFSAFYRTLIRAVTDQFRAWEQVHSRTFFSFIAGRSAVMTVWAQAALQEVTTVIGKPSAATILWDLSDFYEGMSRTKLLCRAGQQHFPAAPTYLSIAAYSGERILQLHGLATSAGYPTRGVVAGCGLATFHVQAYHGPPMQRLVDTQPRMALNIHIDDLTLTSNERSDDLVVEHIARGAAALQSVIEQELDSSISVAKADLIATTDALRNRVGKILEQFGGKKTVATAVNLGIDVTGGIAQGRARVSKLKSRLAAQVTRKQRLRRLARVNRAGATKVFNLGVLPAIEYGTQVWGYSTQALRDLQSFYLSAVAPPGRGKSRSLALLLWDDMSWRPATAPILAYAKIIWQAMTSPQIAVVPLTTLVGWYNAASRRSMPRNWGEVTGPFSAMHLSLDRIGWKLVSFAVMRDHREQTHNVASIGPKMLAGLLRAAWRDRIGQQAAAKVSERIGIHAATWEEPHETPKSLDLYHAKQLAKSKVAGENLLTSFQISCMDNFVVGGVWPQTRLHEAGYEVDVRCQLCLEAEDTLDHRLFCCRYSRDARAQLVWEEGGGSLAEARAHPLASRGLAGDPARGQPGPAAEGNKNYQYTELDFTDAFCQAAYIFTDGGCTKPWHPQLRRASWSVVAANNEGEHTAACLGPVWATLPQTSQVGEVCGLASTRQLATGIPKKLYTDSTTVVRVAKIVDRRTAKSCGLGFTNTAGSGYFAGILRESGQEPGARLLFDARHVKSHQADDGILPEGITEEEEIAIFGNKAADEMATEGLEMHPAFNIEKLNLARKTFLMAKNILLLAARALPAWNSNKGKKVYREEVLQDKSARAFQRQLAKQEPPPTELLTADGGHFWLQVGYTGHRCAFCPARAANPAQRARRSAQVCPRDLGQLGRVLDKADETKHHLFWSVHQRTGMRLLSCSRCDSYATIAPKKLLEPCVAKVRRPNWERLKCGKFPTNRFGKSACLSLPFPATKADGLRGAPDFVYDEG